MADVTLLPAVPGTSLRVRVPTSSPQLRSFLRTEASGALFLLAAAVVALVWANSPWSDSYTSFWHLEAGFSIGDLGVSMDLRDWVNDAAMSVFFLVVGLEISRELGSGEMRDRRAAAVPALGAIGGLTVPALIYLAFNAGTDASHGWGVAMSTDTAFVLGVLALAGPRCPERLRLFLLTLAIVDDIGAITVMALFYTDSVSVPALVVSLVVVGLIVLLRWLRVWQLTPYVLAAITLWLAVHASGVHATLAGVLVGLLVPARGGDQESLDALPVFGRALRFWPTARRAQLTVRAARASVPTNSRLETALHPWSAFVIVPVFGLANAGVSLAPDVLHDAFTSRVTVGVAVALVVGNSIGIPLASWIALRTGLGVLPGGVRYGHLVGGAVLAGIGFTISLFIAELAFDDPVVRDQAKIGVLAGSVVAAVLGSFLLRFLGERSPMCTPDDSAWPAALPPRPWREPVDA